MNYDFAPKYRTCPSCKSNNTTKRHHMWSGDLLHFTLYYMLFLPQTSNLFLNISYGSVFLKMCYIMWLWCHRNVTHVIELYRIRKDGGHSCWKKKNRRHVKISCSATPLDTASEIFTSTKVEWRFSDSAKSARNKSWRNARFITTNDPYTHWSTTMITK